MPQDQKRSLEEAESFLEGVKVLLLDIEGTITPINFVKDTLFPYVTENLESFLTTRYEEEETKNDIEALRSLAVKDKEGGAEVTEIPSGDNKEEVVKAVCANVKAQMDADRKSTELKQLQGHVWREGYKQKKIAGELFEDVNPVLQQLKDEEFRLYIFSSGSVEAQKLLVQNSSEGDLTELFSGYFDTTTGPKTEADSYKKIKAEIDSAGELQSDEILFLTDDPAEAAAACEAGLQAVIVDRSIEQEGGIELDEEVRKNFPVIDNLNELFGEEDEDDEEFAQMKRQHLAAGNGEFDDEDDEEGLEGEEEDEEVGEDVDEDEEGEDEEEEEP